MNPEKQASLYYGIISLNSLHSVHSPFPRRLLLSAKMIQQDLL